MNKRILKLLVFSSLGLGACVTNDMVNNDFVGAVNQAPPQSLVGNWTGSMSGSIATLQVKENGLSDYCYAGPMHSGQQQVKYIGNNIFLFQDGSKLEAKNIGRKTVDFEAPYFGSNLKTFYKDKRLSKAAKYCRDK